MRVQGSRYRSDRYRRLVTVTSQAIAEGVESGLFRVVDPHKVAAMFVDSMIAVMNQRLLSDKPAVVEDDAELIAALFNQGLEKKKK